MENEIKHWYFTADVCKITRETREILERRTFTRADWSREKFFPIYEAVNMITTVLRERENFFNPNVEFCSVRIINQLEISEAHYKSLTDEFGFLHNGGQFI